MNILILGPQGSGKGTQARLLAEKYNLFYLESGGFLRNLAKNDPKIDEIINKSGQLLPDEETVKYITSYLEDKAQNGDSILFDGFPRTIKQYELFKGWLGKKSKKINFVIVLNISDEEAVKRLSGRRMDPKTGKIYNLVTDPPPPEIDVSILVQREDDKPEAIKKRLDWYKSLVVPLIDQLSKETVVIKLDGERPIETIFNNIIERIESKNAR